MIGKSIRTGERARAHFSWCNKIAAVTLVAGLSACATQGPISREGSPGASLPIIFKDSNYGPLSFNGRKGADFYVTQEGHFAEGKVANGSIEIRLRNASFQIGHNGEQMNLCLAQAPFAEVRSDPSGYKASCLAGAMAGAHRPGQLLVYSGTRWSDGNTEFGNKANSLRVDPMPGYKAAYQINELVFTSTTNDLAHFKGTLFGYIIVYKQHERSNRDIAAIRLVFE